VAFYQGKKMGKIKSCSGGHMVWEREGFRFCPRCGAPLKEVAEYFTDWDELQKQYQVRLVFSDVTLTSQQEEYFQNLAGTIASNSACSCGGALAPFKYALHKQGTEITFEGTYVCSECRATNSGNNVSVRLLLLTADPTDATRLRLGEELREIQEKLQLAKMREHFQIHQRMSVRPADISQALLDIQPQIVHFSGHGTATGALFFENQLAQVHPIQPDALAALFEQFTNHVRCVVLNACFAETQARAIAKYIEFVIGMNQAIGDKASIAYSIGFYQALGAGRAIEDAHKLGCVQIRLQGIPEHLTPVLLRRG
jgi:hypothetical protein